MMLIVYDSLTGLSKKTALLLDKNALSVKEITTINQDCLLITRSIGFGNVPVTTLEFVRKNLPYIKGVAVSGNKNWGTNYGAAGDKIQEEFGIPLVLKFEAFGMKEDIEYLKKWIGENCNE